MIINKYSEKKKRKAYTLLVIRNDTKENFSYEPEKTNFKSYKFSQDEILPMILTVFSQFL